MMRPSGLLRFYRTRLRSRAGQEALAVTGIAVGVALIFSALVAAASLTGSVRQLTDGIVGSARLQMVASTAQGMPEDVLRDVAAVPGVEGAAPLLEARANVAGPRGRASVTLVGGDPAFSRIGGPLVRQFAPADLELPAVTLPDPLARRLGLGLYDQVELQTGEGTTSLPLVAKLQAADIGSLTHSPVAILPLRTAQRITGMPGRISRIFVRPVGGRDAAVRAALERIAGDRARVLPADFDVALFEQASVPTNQSTTLFSALASLVGFLFALAAVLLTVPQRRALIALLGRNGYAPGAIAVILLFDALVLAILGATAGLALGDQLSRHLYGGVPGYLATGFPIGDQRIVTPATVAIASAAALVAAVGAVLAPLAIDARAARRRLPRRARSTAHWPALAGATALLVAVGIAAWAPEASIGGLIALTAAVLLVLPAALRAAVRLARATTQRLRSGPVAVALLELRSASTTLRTFVLAATGAIAVFSAVAVGGARHDLVRGLDQSARDVDDNADVWVTFSGTTSPFAVTPFRIGDAALQRVGRIRDVASVEVYRGSFFDLADLRVWVQAPPAAAPAPVPPHQLVDGDLARATAAVRRGGAVAVSRIVADRLDLRIGDRLSPPTLGGGSYRVAAILNNLGWPTGTIVLNAADYARSWGTRQPSALQVRVRPGAEPAAVAHAVRRVLDDSALTVQTRQQRIAEHREAVRQGLVRLTQISVLILLAAVLAMATATGAAIWQRRAALRATKTHGYSPGELWRALLVESVLLLGVGCLTGALAGLLGQALLARALATVTGFPVDHAPAWTVAGSVVGVVLVGALAIIAVPGWLATRTPRPARAQA